MTFSECVGGDGVGTFKYVKQSTYSRNRNCVHVLRVENFDFDLARQKSVRNAKHGKSARSVCLENDEIRGFFLYSSSSQCIRKHKRGMKSTTVEGICSPEIDQNVVCTCCVRRRTTLHRGRLFRSDSVRSYGD